MTNRFTITHQSNRHNLTNRNHVFYPFLVHLLKVKLLTLEPLLLQHPLVDLLLKAFSIISIRSKYFSHIDQKYARREQYFWLSLPSCSSSCSFWCVSRRAGPTESIILYIVKRLLLKTFALVYFVVAHRDLCCWLITGTF